MADLALLALLNSIREWGFAPVIASRVVVADAAALRAMVADPASQWRLVDGISALLRPAARVESRAAARVVRACVSLAGHDVLWLTWILTRGRGTTEVDLAAQVESRALVVRLALLLGGRRMLRHHLDATLAVLATLAHRAAEDLDGLDLHDARAAGAVAGPRRHDSFGTTPTQGAT